VTGLPASELLELLGGLKSLGVFARLRREEHEGELGISDIVAIEWVDLSIEEESGPATEVADAMVRLATIGYCTQHGLAALDALDFGQLASVTAETDSHDQP
jgi:hypothetical protein